MAISQSHSMFRLFTLSGSEVAVIKVTSAFKPDGNLKKCGFSE